ncbi:MAG: hypothetical protein V3V10_09435, partial [Planctomycetota bacterium]
ASGVSAQQIDVTPASSPFEIMAGVPASLSFNICVTKEDEPAPFADEVTATIVMRGVEDEETGLVLLPLEAEWVFFEGFAAGQRHLRLAVMGDVPVDGTVLATTATIVFAGQEPLEVAVELQVRGSTPDRDLADSNIDFCVQPGTGEADNSASYGYGMQARLYSNFRRVQVVGSFSFNNAASATIKASTVLEIVEVIEEDDSRIPTDMALTSRLRVIDADGDGLAEAVTFLATIRSKKLKVKLGARRLFEVRAYRTDVLPKAAIILGEFEVVRRAYTDGDNFATIGGRDYVWAEFGREQSKPLTAEPILLRNGQRLPAPAQAFATVVPAGENASPTSSGLFDLEWVVDIDWGKLSKFVAFEVGDTLSVRMRFPKSRVAPLTVDMEVTKVGVNAVYLTTVEELEAKEYDNDKTEQDYVDELMEALCKAGLVVDSDGNLSLPGLFGHGNYDNAGDIQDALRAAILAYKNALRKVDGKDCLKGKKPWEIEVKFKKRMPSTKDDDGNVVLGKEVEITVVIVIGPKGKKAKATDGKKDGPKLVIAVGRCGEDDNKDPNKSEGQDAGVTINQPGSVGIAVGGNGGDEPDRTLGESITAEGKKKGRGGKATAEVKKTAGEGRSSKGATAVALGGHGGDADADGRLSGNGGDAKATAEKGAKGKVAAGGGNSGYVSSPPPVPPTRKGAAPSKKGIYGGNTEVENGDSVGGKGRSHEGIGVHNPGLEGEVIGGVATAEPRRTAGGKPSQPNTKEPEGPITGD